MHVPCCSAVDDKVDQLGRVSVAEDVIPTEECATPRCCDVAWICGRLTLDMTVSGALARSGCLRPVPPRRTHFLGDGDGSAGVRVRVMVKFPVVPGAPADGIVCDLPLSWLEGSTELTFTLKLDRAGATENSVTINTVMYLKGTAEDKGAPLATKLDPPVPPEQPLPPPLEQLAPEAVLPDVVLTGGNRFIILDSAYDMYSIAVVVAANTDATRYMLGANGEKYHVEVQVYTSAEDMQTAAVGLGSRTLDDCFVVRVTHMRVRSSARSRKRARLSHPPSETVASDHVDPLPTIVDYLEDSADLSVGLTVLAYGRSPGGDWTQYRAVIKAFRDRPPYVVVKYTADVAGNALRLLLPSPITAYLSRTDIELLEPTVV